MAPIIQPLQCHRAARGEEPKFHHPLFWPCLSKSTSAAGGHGVPSHPRRHHRPAEGRWRTRTCVSRMQVRIRRKGGCPWQMRPLLRIHLVAPCVGRLPEQPVSRLCSVDLVSWSGVDKIHTTPLARCSQGQNRKRAGLQARWMLARPRLPIVVVPSTTPPSAYKQDESLARPRLPIVVVPSKTPPPLRDGVVHGLSHLI